MVLTTKTTKPHAQRPTRSRIRVCNPLGVESSGRGRARREGLGEVVLGWGGRAKVQVEVLTSGMVTHAPSIARPSTARSSPRRCSDRAVRTGPIERRRTVSQPCTKNVRHSPRRPRNRTTRNAHHQVPVPPWVVSSGRACRDGLGEVVLDWGRGGGKSTGRYHVECHTHAA